MSTETTTPPSSARQMLNKVPEVTLWFWVIKILCTTVGESFADWINMQLGVGLTDTALIFTGVLLAVLGWQFSLKRYVPFAYWLTVVVVSVTGTLYTDILTDNQGVPLWISSSVFAVMLAAVFGIWWARERTLSIHSIVTSPREAFYWLAILVTFALGTAVGDWTLELTGWSPGVSVLLPLGLIAIIVACWRAGANPVLSFWLAYILTRPLGANLGDWFASPKADKGLGLGTATTSVVFLGAILATVVYLTVTKSDVIEEHERVARMAKYHRPHREKVLVAVMAIASVSTGFLLNWASAQPHANALSEEEGAAPTSNVQLTPTQATAHFPATDVASLRTIAADTLAKVQAGDQAGAATRVTDLESAWDDGEDTLKPLDGTAWDYLDGKIDTVLTSIRAGSPDQATEEKALDALIASLS
jgi:uncharacterized membrane-anchored protein